MQKFIFIISSFVFTSCFMTRKEIILPGKIAVKIDDTCFIYDNSNTATAKFKIMSDRNIQYSGFMWLNNSDRFIGTEYFEN